MEHKGMELLQGKSYGRRDIDSLDNSGGGGEFDAFFIRDSEKKQRERARKELKRLLTIEDRLKHLKFRHTKNQKAFERLLEHYQSRKSQEGTKSYG